MKPLSARMRVRLDAALDFVLKHLQIGSEPQDIIHGLTREHGANCAFRSGTYCLSCAGTTGSATSGAPSQVLGSWRRNAVNRLSYLNL